MKKKNLNLPEGPAKAIASGIAAVRNHLGLSQAEFGKKISLSQNYMSQVENGGRIPSADVFILLFSVYNINMQFLFSGKGEMFHSESDDSMDQSLASFKSDFDSDTYKRVKELFWQIRHLPMVRYAILEFFDGYQITKESLINKLIDSLGLKKPGKD